MLRNSYWFVFIVVCLSLMLLTGCGSTLDKNNSSGASTKAYYSIGDFNSIIVGESTYQDVYKIAPMESMQITSYGGFCEYPMQSGGYIRIEFYGKDLIVGVVKEIRE